MPKRIIKHAQQHPLMWQIIGVTSVIAASIFVAFAVIMPLKVKQVEKTQVSISGKRITTISKDTEEDIDKVMSKETLITATAVVATDLAKNQRKTIFFKSKIPQMQAIWDNYVKNRVSAPQLFSSAAIQNDRIVQLINGNMDCREFSKSLGYQYYPDMNSFGPWICSMSIPPGFDGSGDFNGFLTFHISREPTDSEKIRIAKYSVELSSTIFKRDAK